MKGKNRLVPRLLGVTKDSVLRLDEKTKEGQIGKKIRNDLKAKLWCCTWQKF